MPKTLASRGSTPFTLGALYLFFTFLCHLPFIISPVRGTSILGDCYYDPKLRERPNDWWNPEHGVLVGIDLTGDCAYIGVQKLKDGPVHVIPDYTTGGGCVPQIQYKTTGFDGDLGMPSIDFDAKVKTLSRLKANADIYLNDNITSAAMAVHLRTGATYEHRQKFAEAAQLAGFTDTVIVLNSVILMIESFAALHEDWFSEVTKDEVSILFVNVVENHGAPDWGLRVDVSLADVEPDWGALSLWKDEVFRVDDVDGVVQGSKSFLQKHEMDPSMIDGIILMGSYTGMPKLRVMLQEHFPNALHIGAIDSDEAVVTGAAALVGRVGHEPSQFEGLVCSGYDPNEVRPGQSCAPDVKSVDALQMCPVERPPWASPSSIAFAAVLCDMDDLLSFEASLGKI